MFDNCQAKAGAAHRTRTGGINPVKTFGQAGQMFTRNAVGLVTHRYRHDTVVAIARECCGRILHQFDFDINHAVLVAIFDGIFDQILKNLNQFLFLADRTGFIECGCDADVHVFGIGFYLETSGNLVDDGGNIAII